MKRRDILQRLVRCSRKKSARKVKGQRRGTKAGDCKKKGRKSHYRRGTAKNTGSGHGPDSAAILGKTGNDGDQDYPSKTKRGKVREPTREGHDVGRSSMVVQSASLHQHLPMARAIPSWGEIRYVFAKESRAEGGNGVWGLKPGRPHRSKVTGHRTKDLSSRFHRRFQAPGTLPMTEWAQTPFPPARKSRLGSSPARPGKDPTRSQSTARSVPPAAFPKTKKQASHKLPRRGSCKKAPERPLEINNKHTSSRATGREFPRKNKAEEKGIVKGGGANGPNGETQVRTRSSSWPGKNYRFSFRGHSAPRPARNAASARQEETKRMRDLEGDSPPSVGKRTNCEKKTTSSFVIGRVSDPANSGWLLPGESDFRRREGDPE